VLIGTPPHLHAAQFCAALEAGKHVYQEKTLALTVADAKRMRKAWREDGARHVIQIGHQACSHGQMDDALDVVGFDDVGDARRVENVHLIDTGQLADVVC
jgi:predicted dehydrogenase